MKLAELEVDSIMDRIMQVVCDAGPMFGITATQASSSVDCSPSVFNIALSALVRDGYLYHNDKHEYFLTGDAMPLYQPRPASGVTATGESNMASEAATKVCNTCDKRKSIEDFSPGAGRCKRCNADAARAKYHANKAATSAPNKGAAKASAAKPAPAGESSGLLGTVHTIEAAGTVQFRELLGLGRFQLTQNEQTIVLDGAQLQRLIDVGLETIKASR